MIKYKILDSIIRKGNYSIPINSGNSDYQQFIQDVAEEGIEIVEYVNIINPSSNEVPAWVQEAADNWTFNKQLREYVTAVERLENYILSEGRPEIREDVVVETREVFNEETGELETVNITENVITQTAIEPLEATVEVYNDETESMETVRNPLIIRDEEERAAAQAVVDATPQAVIDAINS